MSMILDIRNVTVRFGGVVALDKVSFGVNSGRISLSDWSQRCRQNHHDASSDRRHQASDCAQVLLAGKDISNSANPQKGALGPRFDSPDRTTLSGQ